MYYIDFTDREQQQVWPPNEQYQRVNIIIASELCCFGLVVVLLSFEWFLKLSQGRFLAKQTSPQWWETSWWPWAFCSCLQQQFLHSLLSSVTLSKWSQQLNRILQKPQTVDEESKQRPLSFHA